MMKAGGGGGHNNKNPRNPFRATRNAATTRHALPRHHAAAAPKKYSQTLQQVCYAILVGTFMVSFLSMSVPLQAAPSKPADLHGAMVAATTTNTDLQQQGPTIPRRGGGIRGQSKLVNLQNLPGALVLANSKSQTNSSGMPKMQPKAAAAASTVVSDATLQEDADTITDSEDEDNATTESQKVASRWIDETKARIRRVDESMQAVISNGAFGRTSMIDEVVNNNDAAAATDADANMVGDGGGTGEDSNATMPEQPALQDEVHVVLALSDKLDAFQEEPFLGKQQPGGPDEESPSGDPASETEETTDGVQNPPAPQQGVVLADTAPQIMETSVVVPKEEVATLSEEQLLVADTTSVVEQEEPLVEMRPPPLPVESQA